jgi:hypothetical protein
MFVPKNKMYYSYNKTKLQCLPQTDSLDLNNNLTSDTSHDLVKDKIERNGNGATCGVLLFFCTIIYI